MLNDFCICYDFDSVHVVHGYSTVRFVRPSDMATISVKQFHKAKNEHKRTGTITNGDALKADLNALFGIQSC